MQLSVLSTEYVRVPIAATSSGATVDPTGDTVQMAFPVHGVDPVNADWKAASWETDATITPHAYYARCLVGPSQVVLAAGTYDVWVKVTDNPEIPARLAGQLQVK